jgi:hypothetical protein
MSLDISFPTGHASFAVERISAGIDFGATRRCMDIRYAPFYEDVMLFLPSRSSVFNL